MRDKVIEHWLLDQSEEDSDTWFACRYTGKNFPQAWGDVVWTHLDGRYKKVFVHVLCGDCDSYREDIQGLLNQMPGMRENFWVTFERVTVDFRE